MYDHVCRDFHCYAKQQVLCDGSVTKMLLTRGMLPDLWLQRLRYAARLQAESMHIKPCCEFRRIETSKRLEKAESRKVYFQTFHYLFFDCLPDASPPEHAPLRVQNVNR